MACQRRVLAGRRDLLAPAAAFPQRYPCLLESVVRGTAQSRYDILFAFPRGRLALHADGRLHDAAGQVRDGRFLDALDRAWRAERQPPGDDDGLPFHGGWVLLLAYELAGEIEPTLRLRPSATLPVALALRCPAAIVIDHAHDCTVLVAEAGDEALLDALRADPAAAPADRLGRGCSAAVSRRRRTHSRASAGRRHFSGEPVAPVACALCDAAHTGIVICHVA